MTAEIHLILIYLKEDVHVNIQRFIKIKKSMQIHVLRAEQTGHTHSNSTK